MKCQTQFSEETICMKCQILFSGKNKKNITKLLSAELDQSVVKVKVNWYTFREGNSVFWGTSEKGSTLKGKHYSQKGFTLKERIHSQREKVPTLKEKNLLPNHLLKKGLL